MASESQIAANRLNAELSTGPQTIEGKAKVASNALRHGLTAERVVLPEEDLEDYDDFLAQIIGTLAPEGAVEEVFAEKFAADAWRLKRVPALEAALHRRPYEDLILDRAKEDVDAAENELNEAEELAQLALDAMQKEPDDKSQPVSTEPDGFRAADVAADQTGKIEDEKPDGQIARLERALRKANAKYNKLTAEPVDIFVRAISIWEEQNETFSKLERYEKALFRSLSRTLHELERLQAARTGKKRGVRDIVEVDVTVDDPKSIEQK